MGKEEIREKKTKRSRGGAEEGEGESGKRRTKRRRIAGNVENKIEKKSWEKIQLENKSLNTGSL